MLFEESFLDPSQPPSSMAHRILRTAAVLAVSAAAAFTPTSMVPEVKPGGPFCGRLSKAPRGFARLPFSRLPGLTMSADATFEGIYDFTHPGGTFDVHLRPGGRFFVMGMCVCIERL